jgi:hypothetical protein
MAPPSYIPHYMASGFCDTHDPDPCQMYEHARFKKESPHEWTSVSSRNRTDWYFLLAQFDLRQPGLSLSFCCFHSDAEGKVAIHREPKWRLLLI